jgi:hypothetical protein
VATKRKQSRQHADTLTELSEWLEFAEYLNEFKKFSSLAAIRRDITNRRFNGLEKAGAVRKVGRRFLIHRTKYTAFRLGELRS